MKTAKEISDMIYEKEKELTELIYNRDIIVKKMEDKVSELTLNTNFKAQNITNANGREAFIKSHTADERTELVEYKKQIGIRNAEIEFLKRTFELVKEKT